METNLFETWHAEGLLSQVSYKKIKERSHRNYVSVHWEIKTLLYLGVLLLSGGLGILVYKNIDSIGHQAILLFIALVCAACYFYCYKFKLPFSTGKVAAPNSFFDYILLLGCCTFITFIAYLQFRYNLFGNRYGLAGFFPMVVLFFSAYFFDHLGILSMAIVNLAAWLGITVTPLHLLESNDFNSTTIIFTGMTQGILLLFMAWITDVKGIKKHFEFTYANFGTHLTLISCLASMFHFSNTYLLWFLLLAAMVYFFYAKALKERSFYFILVTTIYAYTGISYVVIMLLDKIGNFNLGLVYLGFIYFIGSAIGLVLFLINSNKKIKAL